MQFQKKIIIWAHLDENLKVVVCGDWCMNGKVEGGFLSAKDAVNKVLKYT